MGYSQPIAFIFLEIILSLFIGMPDIAVGANNPPAKNTIRTLNTGARPYIDRWFPSVGYLWWQEPLLLTKPTGEQYVLLATANGPCLGGGWRRIYSKYEFNIQGCGFFGFNEVGSTHQLLTYYQQEVASYGALLGPGFMWRLQQGVINIGLQAPVIYRYGDWTLPAEGYTIDSVSKVSGGLLLEAKWVKNKISLSQKIGYLYSMGFLWVLQLNLR